MAKRPIPKKPAPQMTRWDGAQYIAPRCPVCGEYPGGEGAKTCQHCGERVYAEAHWDGGEQGGFFARLFGLRRARS